METATTVEVEELTQEQGRQLVASRVADRLGITLDAFLQKAESGEYDGTEDRDVLYLLTLIPFAR